MHWACLPFAELSVQQLHDALALRAEVFVVEQDCVFLDIDGLDPQCRHLLGQADDGRLQAYARLIPPGLKAQDALICRVRPAPPSRCTPRPIWPGSTPASASCRSARSTSKTASPTSK